MFWSIAKIIKSQKNLPKDIPCINRILGLTLYQRWSNNLSLDVHSLWIYRRFQTTYFRSSRHVSSSSSKIPSSCFRASLAQRRRSQLSPAWPSFVGRIHPTALFPTVLPVASWETKNRHFPIFLQPDRRLLARIHPTAPLEQHGGYCWLGGWSWSRWWLWWLYFKQIQLSVTVEQGIFPVMGIRTTQMIILGPLCGSCIFQNISSCIFHHSGNREILCNYVLARL